MTLKDSLLLEVYLFDAAELAFAASTDINELNKVALGMGIGALVGPLGAIGAPVGLAGVMTAVVSCVASKIFETAYDALELWNQSHAFPESEYQDWLNESKFHEIENFGSILEQISQAEETNLLTYKLDNGVSFYDESLLHQQIMDKLAPMSGGDIFSTFVGREQLIRQFKNTSSDKAKGIEGFILTLEALFWGQDNGSITSEAEYLSRASHLLSYIDNNAGQNWKLVKTASLEHAANKNTTDGYAYRYALENASPIAIIW